MKASKPFAVYSIFIFPFCTGTGHRELISRHRWNWVAQLWAIECGKLFAGYRYEVVDEREEKH